MDSIGQTPSICISCERTIPFSTSNENEKRRHVAIVHGKETFSSLRCGKCQRKYFDFDHFSEHLETSSECPKESWTIKSEPLSDHLEMAFDALVKQMMRPVSECTVETDQTEKGPNSGGNGEGETDITSGEASKRSMVSSTGMDRVKRKRMEDTSVRDGPSSAKGQRRIVTRAMNTTGEGKLIKDENVSINIIRKRKTEKWKEHQRSNEANESDGRGTGTTTPAGDDPNRANEQFKCRPATVRREYCLALIDKFATEGKLKCQLCSVEFIAMKRTGAYQGRSITEPIQHALRHLEKPMYRCRLCNITKFTDGAIRHHVREHHLKKHDGYEDCADQYHQEIMDMLGQCFDSLKNRPVEEARNLSACSVNNSENKCTPGQFKIQPAVVRREYCLDLIEKFSTAGKLQCQLCSVTCGVFRTWKSSQKIITDRVMQHALGHLRKPIYRCRICNVTKFTVGVVQVHTRQHHPRTEEGYEDCADQYHQEIMDMLRLCFHVNKKQSTMEQVPNVLAIRGRFYQDTRSPLHNERLHCVRSLAAHYSNQTRISCQLCSKMCTVNGTDSNISIRNHVMVHLNKDIFQCILCGTHCNSYSPLKTHIQKYHQLQNIQGAYMDYSDKYHQEFINMLGKCFDPDSGNGLVKAKKASSCVSGGTRRKAVSGGTGQGF